jgi:hypothetical protein
MTKRLPLTALCLCLGLLLSCSDDEPSEADAAAVDSLATELASEESRLQTEEDEARCVAEAVVDDLGADRVEALDFRLVQPPLTAAEADDVYAAFDDCVQLTDRLTESLSGDLPPEQARCGAEAYVDSGLLKESLLTKSPTPSFNAQIDSTIAQAVARC